MRLGGPGNIERGENARLTPRLCGKVAREGEEMPDRRASSLGKIGTRPLDTDRTAIPRRVRAA